MNHDQNPKKIDEDVIKLEINNPESNTIDIKIQPQDLEIKDDGDDAGEFLDDALDTGADAKENSSGDTSDFNDVSDENVDNNPSNNDLEQDNSRNSVSDGENLDIGDETESDSHDKMSENENQDSEDKKDGEDKSGLEDKKDDENKSDSEDKKGDENKSDSENKKDDENKSDSENKKDGENKSDSENKKDDENKSDSENKKDDENKSDNKDKKDDGKKPDSEDKKDNENRSDNKDKKDDGKKSDDNDKKNDDKKTDDKDKKDDNKSAADKKRDEAKQKQANNRSNGAKPGLKDRAKNGIKNAPKNMANKAKNKAKESLEDSSLGQAVDNAKKTVETVKETVQKSKKAVEFLIKHWKIVSGVAIGIVVFIIMLFIITWFISIGKNGNVEEENFEEKYVEKDKNTIEKLKNECFNGIGDADTRALAMAAVTYPFFSELQSSNVKNYLEGNDVCDDDSNSEDCESDSEEDEEKDDTDEDVSEDEDSMDYDIYLRPFYKKHIRKDLRETIEGLNGKTEEEQNAYLKETVFNRGGMYLLESKKFITGYNGYKNLFKKMKSGENKEELENQIIENIREISSQFLPYVFESTLCVGNLIDAGTIDAADLIKNAVAGNVYVDLKKPGCSSMSKCSESYYSSPLSLKDYIMGVVYEELGENNNVDQLAAQAVAAQSFTLARRINQIKKTEEGAYVIPMLWSTADQDFCHVDLGCNSPDIKEEYGYNTNGDDRLKHFANRPSANSKRKSLLEQAWEKAKDVYIVDKSGNAVHASYYEGPKCEPGSCMNQTKLEQMTLDFKSILGYFYSNHSVSTISSDGIATIQVASAQECNENAGSVAAKRNLIKSFSLESVNKGIPYYEGGLPNSKVYEENNFNTDVSPDVNGRTKKGLNGVGFINFVYWNAIDENFGNKNNINNIISKTYDITKEELLVGDIGISSDNTLIGIYLGEEKWAYESKISGHSVVEPNNNFKVFKRLNEFKYESYDYTIRTKIPTVNEWSNMKHYYDTTNTCQCVWYAKNRAIEIINELYNKNSITKKQYDTYIKRISNTRGNGNQFTLSGSINSNKAFKGSNNISDFKTGSFIGMKSWYSSAGQIYGHVVIIEKVDFENKKIYTTDGSKRGSCSRYNYSGLKFGYKEYTFDEFYQRYKVGDGQKFDFYGYLYFLED